MKIITRRMTCAGLLLVMLGLSSACQSATPQLEATHAAPTPVATEAKVVATRAQPSPTATAAATATATVTALPPTPTNTPLPEPTALPSETATALPTDTPVAAPTSDTAAGSGAAPARRGSGMKTFLVVLASPGTAGCGVLAPVYTGIPASGIQSTDIKAVLNGLFQMKSKYVGGLYNPVSFSTLKAQRVEFNNGLLSVWLSGKYRPTGDACDNTRVKAQIWTTAKQFGDVIATNFFLNGIPFGDFLSNDK
jgi:hypothetical protein